MCYCTLQGRTFRPIPIKPYHDTKDLLRAKLNERKCAPEAEHKRKHTRVQQAHGHRRA